jgi:hypothetical protein
MQQLHMNTIKCVSGGHDSTATAVTLGKYSHFKTHNLYEVIGMAVHSETLEEMVIYKALYESETYGLDQLWVRPAKMFLETVKHNDIYVPRFLYIAE